MRRLLPEPAARTDPYEEYRVAGPWLRLGLVASLDGSATDEKGWPSGLADRRVLHTLRALADGVLVGAGTVRKGRIGPVRLPAELARRRGCPPAPLIVVSRSLDLDWSAPLFTESEPILVTSDDARPPAHVRVVSAGEGDVDLPLALHRLHAEHGFGHLLCEGGPTLATALLRAGLVDDLCLTLAPTLIGTLHHTPLICDLPRHDLTLDSAYTTQNTLFLRYLTNRTR